MIGDQRAHWRFLKPLAAWGLVLVWAAAGAEAPGSARAGSPVPLSLEEGDWKRTVFVDGRYRGIDEDNAAVFAAGEDQDQGRYLAVGPWRAGFWAARWSYRPLIPWPRLTITGSYRTETVLPFGATVTVEFLKGSSRLAVRKHYLEPSPDWRRLAVTERFPPAGADAVTLSVGLDEPTPGRILFAALAVEEGAVAPVFPASPPASGRALPPAAYPAGKRYRLEQAGETFWLVRPRGKPFYSLGTVGPALHADPDPEEAGDRAARTMRSLGFNSLAGWTHIRSWAAANRYLKEQGRKPLPLFAVVETDDSAEFDRLLDAGGQHGSGPGFPDPFDPAFRRAFRAAVERIRSITGRARWFVGYFSGNELPHHELYRYVYSPHASRAFVRSLESRYRTVSALNESWGSHYGSFDQVVAERPDPAALGEGARSAFLGFEREIVRQYVALTVETVRSVDPGRLVFSNRLSTGAVETGARVLDLYRAYDGVAVNLYPSNEGPGLSGVEKGFLALVHNLSGRPLIVSEWSVPALDSGLYETEDRDGLDHSWNELVATQAERGAQAALVTADLHSLPFVVGSHWFTWEDIEKRKRHANRGLFRADETPWKVLQEHLRDENRRLGDR